MRIRVKVVPGSRRESVEKFGDGYKVRASVPAEKGRANERVRELLAQKLGCRTADVRILSGHSSAMKWVEIPHLLTISKASN